ncbi:hypothetical protein FRB97_006551 [Tulasnella sp. 331]|nr:hypothetical protein FRB97_006551 [Tulasnella sp. 331]
MELESASSKAFFSSSGAAPGAGTTGSGGSGGNGSAGAGTNATSMSKRTTVVCQECKRLKLRCDRRLPCDQCTKRSTTTKCKYSAQAAEK